MKGRKCAAVDEWAEEEDGGAGALAVFFVLSCSLLVLHWWIFASIEAPMSDPSPAFGFSLRP